MKRKKLTKDSHAEPGPVPRNAETVRRLLLDAYDAGNRSLPWRGESDPYRIWVSEVMLQQTRVETVVPYYERWLERFPDMDSLAAANEDEVLRIWQGLGYYSRARRLQEGARVVRERYSGTLPEKSEELRKLPGIGEYTAGAIASIAFGEAVPAVDGNVKRVLSRLFDLADPSATQFRSFATHLIDPQRPGDFNQALMELGALVCVPRSPRCEACPLEAECLALERGTVAERPAKRPKKTVPELEMVVLVAAARDDEGGLHVLLRKRPATGLLAGMWEFPGMELAANSGLEEALNFLIKGLGLVSTQGIGPSELGPVHHVFSHLKVRYRPFLLRASLPSGLASGQALGRVPDLDGPQWIPVETLDQVPLPVAQGKIAKAAMEALKG
jgi:A/G-specific adenine glycosylase